MLALNLDPFIKLIFELIDISDSYTDYFSKLTLHRFLLAVQCSGMRDINRIVLKIKKKKLKIFLFLLQCKHSGTELKQIRFKTWLQHMKVNFGFHQILICLDTD